MRTSLLPRTPTEPPSSGPVVRALPFMGDDAALVAGKRAGNRAASAAFYDRYEGHVMRTLVRVLGAERELDDLHHDVLVSAIGSIHELRDASALKPWLTSLTVFTARTAILRRSRRWWLRLVPWYELHEVEAPIASGDVTEAMRVTYATLEQLPADERIAFALRFIGGMELTEVGVTSRWPRPAASRRRIRLAISTLCSTRRSRSDVGSGRGCRIGPANHIWRSPDSAGDLRM